MAALGVIDESITEKCLHLGSVGALHLEKQEKRRRQSLDSCLARKRANRLKLGIVDGRTREKT